MVRVKICGITNLEDALAAVAAGADALGFVLAPSQRQVTPEKIAEIVTKLPPLLTKVGVFANMELEKVREIMASCSLDLAQLHGEESPEYCLTLSPRAIKAFRVKDDTFLSVLPRYKAAAFLLDSYDASLKGGTGQVFDWSLAQRAKDYGPVILSGGLTPENVRQAIKHVLPYGVDVSSGVESRPGKKDHKKLKAFIQAVKG